VKAGIVTVCGKPNAGKSTLLNRVIGQKLSITSPKPQSTRDRIVGIHTQGDVQMVIFDTPGLLLPKYALQRAMRANASRPSRTQTSSSTSSIRSTVRRPRSRKPRTSIARRVRQS